jgi:succinate dehydrogenase / fumarate reductase cytochrome b subunit
VTGFKSFFNSSVGCKMIMAVTGLMLVGFLIAHLSGNLLVFKGPHAINTYAKTLRDYIEVLWVLRIGLFAAAALHIYCAIRLTSMNRKTKKHQYKVKSYKRSTYVARSMMLSGLVLLSFAFYHLAHLTFRVTHEEFALLGHYDVYSMLILSFKSPLITFFYCLSICLLMAHLVHGLQSFWRTLGLRHEKYNNFLNRGSVLLGVVLALGFLSIPASIFFGIIQ